MPIQQRSQLKGFGQSTNEKYIVEDINDLVVSANNSSPYKVYSALISQSGTSNPTVTVLQNTIGTIDVTRNSTGVYYFSSLVFNGFSSNDKVLVFLLNGQSTTGIYIAQYVPPINAVQLTSLNTSNVVTDTLLNNASIEIRLYN